MAKMRNPLRLFAALFATSAILSAAALGAPSMPMKVEVLMSMRNLAPHQPIALSSDGRLVAYVIDRPTNEVTVLTDAEFQSSGVPVGMRNTDVWLTDTETGKTRSLTSGIGANWAPRWSSDGSSLAFLSDRSGASHVWIWNRNLGTLRQLSAVSVLSYGEEFQWSASGKELLVTLRSKASGDDTVSNTSSPDSPAPGDSTAQVFSTSSQNASTEGLFHTDLALVDARTGVEQRIVAGLPGLACALVSPDGTQIALVSQVRQRAQRSFRPLYDLAIVTLEGAKRNLISTVVSGVAISRYGLDVTWSPDGSLLAYQADTDLVFGEGQSNVYVASLGSKPRQLTQGKHPDIQGKPVWSEDGAYLFLIGKHNVWRLSVKNGQERELIHRPNTEIKSVVTTSENRDRAWSRKPDSIVIVSEDVSAARFEELSTSTGRASLLFAQQKHIQVLDPLTTADNVLAAARSQKLVYVAEDPQHPADLWVADENFHASHQISHLNPDLDSIEMGVRRLIDWKGRDGTEQTGVLLLPSGYRAGTSYPLIVFVYPTPALPYAGVFGTSVEPTFFNLQLLATRGYAVLFAGPVLPGRGEPSKEIADAVLPAIDRSVALGIADPERLGVMGESAGGHSVLALITQSKRFSAAVEECGIGNLFSLYAALDGDGYSHGVTSDEASFFRMPGDPWHFKEQYTRNSPWYFLDDVATPLLIIHGTADSAVPVSQANEIFNGLRRLGKEVQYLRYRNERHGLSLLANRIDATQRYLAWFDRFLKPH
jgi:dipeptidyl aminopeptidase/acylaminoacyl peptidase